MGMSYQASHYYVSRVDRWVQDCWLLFPLSVTRKTFQHCGNQPVELKLPRLYQFDFSKFYESNMRCLQKQGLIASSEE